MTLPASSSFILDWAERQRLINDFLYSSSCPKYVFGCNMIAVRISNLVEIDGFVDDKLDVLEFANKPVLKSSQIPNNSIVVSAIVGVKPVSVERHLHQLGVAHVDYFSLFKESKLDLLPVPFWEGAHEDMMNNLALYQSVLKRLHDEESKKCFSDFIDFRRTLDLRFMSEYADRQKEQYFEEFLQLERPGLDFFDIGCFDGYTSREFARLSPSYSTISAFEPVPRLFRNCVDNLKDLSRCQVFNFGASNVATETTFEDAGSSSTANSSGEVVVSLKRLDDEMLPMADLIKIDIEGTEVAALDGLQHLITTNKPSLAVACYHYASQVLDLISLWDSMKLKGDLFFRHYTEGTTESVLFLHQG